MRGFGDRDSLLPMSIAHNSRLVAIVDDDESVRSALQDLVESAGLSALSFGSVEQFLESDARQTAVCVIADIRLPGMSGLELQETLKAEECRIPIIFITAHGDEHRIHVMRNGALGFLTKPFDDSALLETIHTAQQGLKGETK